MSNTEQPILIITGMHRSGTSLTSSLLASAGLDIGKNLLEAGEGNPKGHFENLEFLNFHQDVLYSLGIDKVGWTSNNKLTPPPPFFAQAQQLIKQNQSLTQPWGWKEPRTSLFLDFWAGLLPNSRFLFIFRRPWEVIDSIYRRGDVIFHHNPQLAIEVWNSYNQAILNFYEQNADRCLILNLNQIIIDPHQLIDKIQEKLAISLNQPATELYEENLLTQDTSESSQRPWIIKNYFPSSLEIYNQLNQIADYQDPILSQFTETPNLDLWALQDWLDVHLLKRKLKCEHNHIEQVYQDLGTAQGKIADLELERQKYYIDKKELGQNLVKLQQKYNQDMASLQQKYDQDIPSLQQKYDQDIPSLRHKYEQDMASSQQKYNQDIASLQQKYDQEIASLEEKYNQYIADLKQQQTELTTDLDQLRYRNAELSSTNNQLKSDLETSKQESNQLKTNLEQSQQESAQLRADVEQLNFHIDQLNSLLEEYDADAKDIHGRYADLHHYAKQLEQESAQRQSQLEQELDQERSHSETAQSRITAMETSKFWKLRKQWFKLKKSVGMGDNE